MRPATLIYGVGTAVEWTKLSSGIHMDKGVLSVSDRKRKK